MPLIKVDNENIFFSFNKSESDQNLLLIHGSGGDHTHWPEKLRNLSGINVYAIDLPGHGQSGGHGRKSVDDYADVTEAFVSAMNLSNVTLAGHSLGGAIVQCLALRHPEWLVRIILVGTGARLRVAPAILDGLLSDFKTTVDLVCDDAFGPTAWESLIQAGRKGFLKTGPEVIHGDYMACDQFDIMERIGEIAFPTLVVCGTADKLTPVKYSKYLCSHISGAEIAVIEDGGHIMGLEKPDEFTGRISRFLKGHKDFG